MESIGLIGAGLLGTALATRIASAGFRVCAFDPDPAAGNRIGAIGGEMAASGIEVARRARRILFCLPGPRQVAETLELLGDEVSPGMIILDATTGNPFEVEVHARQLAGRGAAYLDCEVGGSSRQAAAGEAIVICGGDRDSFEAARDILFAISPKVFHTGPPGTGTRMKLALNIAIGLHRAVLAESLVFARRNGIDPELALEILKAGPAYSRAMDVKGARMLSGDFTPEARLAQHLKDVRLILETGAVTGARLPLSEVHEKLLLEALERGFGAEDNSAVFKLFGGR